jgi:thiol-disulfide isomerase/thioredoxin
MSGFTVSTLDYADYRGHDEAATVNTCLFLGLAVLALYTMSRPASPVFCQPVHRATTTAYAALATLGQVVSARAASQMSQVGQQLGLGGNVMSAKKALGIDSNVPVIDANGGKEAYKHMSDAEKEACYAALQDQLPAKVLFFAHWCPHCHDAIPAFCAEAAKAGSKCIMVNVGALPEKALRDYAVDYMPKVADLPAATSASAKTSAKTSATTSAKVAHFAEAAAAPQGGGSFMDELFG